MSRKKGFEKLPTDEDWDDDDSPFVEAESHLVTVSRLRRGSGKRCCLCVVLPFTVLGVLVLAAVIIGLAVYATSGASHGPGGGGGSGSGTGGTITLHVNTTLLAQSGDWVTVTWENVDSPSSSDWIGVYSPPVNGTIDAKNHAPIKFQHADFTSTHMSEGSGSLQFRLVNMRAEVIFGFFRSGLDTSTEIAQFRNPVPVAMSDVVRFQNWNEPLQAHLALTGDPTEMVLSWVTRDSQNPTVKWGTASGVYSDTKQATSGTYSASDMCGTPATDIGYRDPGMLHQVTMNSLIPGMKYYYQFGDNSSASGNSWSREFTFRAAPLPGPDISTRVVVYGDMGCGQVDQSLQVIRAQQPAINTTRLVLNQIDQTDLVLHIGDISYARGYASVWDDFFDLIQPVSARVPYMVCIGNHERDWPNSGSFYGVSDSYGECGVPHERRFPMPRPSLDEAWYAFDYGSIHFVLMSTEHNFTEGSPQYSYLESHLANVNRSVTPWVVFAGHRPMYCDSVDPTPVTPDGIQPVAVLLRQSLEPLFKNHGVDLALWGHDHSYQRTCQVYQEKCDNVSTVHAIVGMGGQYLGTQSYRERTAPPWIEVLDYQHYGFSTVSANATTLVLELVWNDDAAVHDTMVLTRAPSGGGGSGSGAGGTISLHVNTTLLARSGDWVTVTWENVDSPSSSDWIGVYSPPVNGTIDAENHAPIKFQHADFTSTHMSEGSGSLEFRLVNMRAEVIFGFFRSGLNTSTKRAQFQNPIPVAVSDVVQFQNWNEPLQAHLALTGDPTEMVLSWVTRDSQNPTVKWWTASGVYSYTEQVTSSTYNASDMCGTPATDFGYRDPGLLHQVTIDGLIPGMRYYYRFGDSGPASGNNWSQEFTFRAAPLPGPNVTTRVVVYGDMGCGQVDQSLQVHRAQQAALNTTHLVLNQIDQTDLVLHIGDISYAEGYASVWDDFFDLIQPVSARVPYMVCIGNHERDWPNSGSFYGVNDSYGECGVPYERRFPMPRPSLDEAWYAFDYGSIHFVLMSTEHNFTEGSPQYSYLESHLANVNRSVTPWVIFAGHRPMYSDFVDPTPVPQDIESVQHVAMLLRESLEPLLKNHGVDLALWGHDHSYQRTCQVYQEKCDNVSTVHAIVGMGGHHLVSQSHYNHTAPPWIEVLDYQHYGFSRVSANATTLVLEFVWNDDAAVHDTMVLTRTPSNS